MKRFAYAADPLCLIACILYAVNRWWFAEKIGGSFFNGYFTDILLIPAALPVALWLQRRLGCRTHDRFPKWNEIALHLVVWSVTAEALIPRLLSHATGDWWDIAAYAGGALVAGICWRDFSFA